VAARSARAAVGDAGDVRSTTAAGVAHFEAALRQGLNEAGFVEGQNVAVWPYLMIARACADKLLLASRLGREGYFRH